MTARDTGICVGCGKRFTINPSGVVRGHILPSWTTGPYVPCPGANAAPAPGSLLPGLPARPPALSKGFKFEARQARKHLAWAEDQVRAALTLRDAMYGAWSDRVRRLDEHERAMAAWWAECERVKSLYAKERA